MADPQGMSLSWEIDLDAMLDALAADSSTPDSRLAARQQAKDQEAVLDAELTAHDTGAVRTLPAGEVAGRVAESLAPGPGLAALLSDVPASVLADHDLPAVAVGFRRIASWAQAAELSAVAQSACRTAAADKKIGDLEDGRPARIGAGAAAQVSLALAMSQLGASWWTDLAVTLTWRLAATGAALAAGDIDLPRARLIAEATSVLSDEAARAVQDKVLRTAGCLTTGKLRAALRRAVIGADPQGAEERRKEAERRTKVSLYPDDEGTATLIGQNLPAILAAAAFARITALAKARKAAGAGGGIDLHRSQVMLGLLLGTLPYIPPAEDAPPDVPPPDVPPPDGLPPDVPPPDGPPPFGDPEGPGWDGQPGGETNGSDMAWEGMPEPYGEDAPAGVAHATSEAGRQDIAMARHGDGDDWRAGALPSPAWPTLPGVIRPGLMRPGFADLAVRQSGQARPGHTQSGQVLALAGPGLLDVTLPWTTLARLSADPGLLGRIGPITGPQARQLAEHAARDPATVWRVVVTSSGGEAVAVGRVRRRRLRDDCGRRDRSDPSAGLVGRMTLVIGEDTLASLSGHRSKGHSGADVLVAASWRTAARAAARAAAQAQADAAAGGCAHQTESHGYRPPPRIHEFVVARDMTCRFPTCRQPAWRGDLDHTIPHDHGGRTCRCNLGALCRTHHLIKQLFGWALCQVRPGIFEWITPANRAYQVTPEIH
ncbi:MAG TPA: HNH endonuclease signature motif containing protein [Streptosporangiaceae bacterium]|nr:HNH endonuclease signature motif containing protein [Streptosporangiaceae bacterium]